MPRIDYDRLLQNVSIVDVARRLGMDIKKVSTTQAKALCPFHDDKSPSLLIDSNNERGRQHYYCFACGAHGDVIDLVKQQLGYSFKEAVEWLSPGTTTAVGYVRQTKNRAKVGIPPDLSGLNLGYKLYKAGATLPALNEWVNERHIDQTVTSRAGLLHAARNFLSQTLVNEPDPSVRRGHAGYLEDSYLIRKLIPGVAANLHLSLNTDNQYCDFFIGERIIFPIYDEQKKLKGLVGRFVGKASATIPKYQFTRGFPKATVLYRADYAFGLVRSKAKAGNKSIHLHLCEGFFDALRFEAIDIPAIAVMGSSISEHQVQLLQKLNEELPKDITLTIVISFDRDEAGLRGAAEASLKLMSAAINCAFLWPTNAQIQGTGSSTVKAKDPDEYLVDLNRDAAHLLVAKATHPAVLAILANAFGILAEDTLDKGLWDSSPPSRRYRAFHRAFRQLHKVFGTSTQSLLNQLIPSIETSQSSSVLTEWSAFISNTALDTKRSLPEDFHNNVEARLNHARILAYMGSRRGELPCDEPRWERLDIAATAFNTLLTDRLSSNQTKAPIGSYDAVWVPRSFGGAEYRLKMMPRPEDLIIQQYLLDEILSERWDHKSYTSAQFSRMIPAVRYYREERKTITTGFDAKGDGVVGELPLRTLSFAYQIDMDVIEGRQPASDQGMYRPFHECWREFMRSVTSQATEIGYVYSIRLDVKRYYDRLRRYVVRDRLLANLISALNTVSDDTPGFAELLNFGNAKPNAENKAAAILDRLDEQLFGVSYSNPDTGLDEETDALIGIPQGPVLSAWIGTVALFPLDEVANQFIDRLNIESTRVGYARYVDDIVLLADDPSILMEMREAVDRCASGLELKLLAKADEIPVMSAEDFVSYINQGRALAASGPAWEPPLIGDGESGWGFWSITPTADRQSALHLLHNVELYKASKQLLLQTVGTAFRAPDLRASELSKGARLIWYAIAVEYAESKDDINTNDLWAQYLDAWHGCMQGTAWKLNPEENSWESPTLFALEGLEHLIDKGDRDIAELSADENALRRRRIFWLSQFVLANDFNSQFPTVLPGPKHQIATRLALVRWKAMRVTGIKPLSDEQVNVERSKLVQAWHPFDWMHAAVTLLSKEDSSAKDPLAPFVNPAKVQTRQMAMSGFSAEIFRALLPDTEENSLTNSHNSEQLNEQSLRIALQTLVSIVPKDQLPACLNRRHRLLWKNQFDSSQNRLIFPPLPGITTTRLFSCLANQSGSSGEVVVNSIEAIYFGPTNDVDNPIFFGSHNGDRVIPLSLEWKIAPVALAEGKLSFLETQLIDNSYLNLRERIQFGMQEFSADVLKQAAQLFRAISKVVIEYAENNEGKELVPAWPYIAASANSEIHYLICDSVLQDELGNRAFVRDGNRALRTLEVPIYEASLWRVGVAISDYLGLHDDVAKFSNSESDLTLDATTIANPARYILRAQFRKLRGAYADSKIGKRRGPSGYLPASVERSLRLLEIFPEQSTDAPFDQLLYVLAAEAESAAMHLSFSERWEHSEIAPFLTGLTTKVLGRLPLSIGELLSSSAESERNLRRDLTGLLCFARRLFTVSTESSLTDLPAWRAFCSGTIATGIFVAIDGLVASMRSHGDFKRYTNFDFPSDWEIPPVSPLFNPEEISSHPKVSSVERVMFSQNLRRLLQYLGHRLLREGEESSRLSNVVYERLKDVAKKLADIDFHGKDAEALLEWPFGMLSNQGLNLLNLDLLESVAELISMIDEEIGFEVNLVMESSYGYNPQTKRFTDSRNGIRDLTPWMISQFPRGAKHIEEIPKEGRIFRIWSEVFDRKNGQLLSVSALGEPFASIAITKPNLNETSLGPIPQTSSNNLSPSVEYQQAELGLQSINEPLTHGNNSANVSSSNENDSELHLGEGHLHDAQTFYKRQSEMWSNRGEERKPKGHVRVALLQADFNLTYKHPLVEVCPTRWPFYSKTKDEVSEYLKSDPDFNKIYGTMLSATEMPGVAHLWMGVDGEAYSLPSWSEHRRKSILKRVIDTCQTFGVDILVLPEYSVRRETIDWLKTYLAKKNVSVLAGTYMNFKRDSNNYLAAPLTLLWPLPNEVSNVISSDLQRRGLGEDEDYDGLNRGHVFEFSRDKKYRSIALNEFFNPSSAELGQLFKPGELGRKIETAIGYELTSDVMSHLLARTRLPLKHLLELICSEIFLVSSPANYRHMADDLNAMNQRFGRMTEPDSTFNDVKKLSALLSITGDGIETRRSILAVPAATSRSADYWIAGQAGFLAAGTATVFCNSIDGKTLVGGSCFIGCGSWKSETSAVGYLSKITPYHGWSKGIYYNDKNDTLSQLDQAVVIADIDPHNMLEGKPRAQTMPSPLQLVAYLPLVESVDWGRTEANILKSHFPLAATSRIVSTQNAIKDEQELWKFVGNARENIDEKSLADLCKIFPDKDAFLSRANASLNNGGMQPMAPACANGIFSSPAFYDWINVSLTLTEQQKLPSIDVPPWKIRMK